jgi:hypothetical protein
VHTQEELIFYLEIFHTVSGYTAGFTILSHRSVQMISMTLEIYILESADAITNMLEIKSNQGCIAESVQ